MDYSLFMVVVFRPFTHVEYFKQTFSGYQEFADVKQTASGEVANTLFEKIKQVQVNGEGDSQKCLFIGELDPKLLSRPGEDLQLILIKEQTRLRKKIFHICDPYDI